jgi:pilus assembly protein CpaF
MTPAAPNTTAPTPSTIHSFRAAQTPQDTRKKAHKWLGDRIDIVRNKHKPLSLLRAEGKRVLEQFYDQEGVALSKAARDTLVEDILAESIGFGPLEEVFRDESVKEILIIDSSLIIGKKNDNWLPMSARFRDTAQVRMVLLRWLESGESYAPSNPSGGFDVRLPNGFRAIAIIPPEILQTPPQVLLFRGAPAIVTTPSNPVLPGIASISSASGISGMSGIHRSVITTPAPRGSGVISGIPSATSSAGVGAEKPESGVITLGSPTSAPTYAQRSSGGQSGTNLLSSQTNSGIYTDPVVRLRQKITEKIITKFAAAGIYDLNSIPLPELRRIILAQVGEMMAHDKLGHDEAMQDRLTLEILAGMSR